VLAVEFVGGCLLTVELLSSLACVALLLDTLVAILTARLSGMPKGLSPLNWLDDLLHFPEVLYVLFFIWLLCSGPGKFSVDYRSPASCRNERPTKQLVAKAVDECNGLWLLTNFIRRISQE
jgi:uncharacterized membrane protein YphA (DoxX/SURF4 family)